MATHFQRTTNFTRVVRVQLIALGIAVSTLSLVTFLHRNFHAGIATNLLANLADCSQPVLEIRLHPQLNSAYQPPITIGSPASSIGSGTR